MQNCQIYAILIVLISDFQEAVMQKILGYLRKAVQRYDMLSDDDRVCVGVSGGKDSVVLLYGLALMKRFIGIDYQVVGLTLDPNFGGVQTDYSPVSDFCATHDIEYHVVQTQIGEIVFDIRKEPNPCSLCARMRCGDVLLRNSLRFAISLP